MDNEIYNFWKEHSLENIEPSTRKEFPEGWNVVEFLKDLNIKYGKIIDIGCGFGRLCTAFNSKDYLGLDFSPDAISKAKLENPEFDFQILSQTELYPVSDSKILFYVLLHQKDEDIENIIKNLCNTTSTIIVAEICGRGWRRKGNPPVFNRELIEYIKLFAKYGKRSTNVMRKPYKHYNSSGYRKLDTDVSIMVFE